MHFSVLGPLRIEDHGVEVTLSAPRQRALLALFLVYANDVVSTDRILDEVWGEETPASGVKTLHYHISKLRESLGSGARLLTKPPGYVLEVSRDELDSYRMEDLAAAGRSQLDSDPALAAATLHGALTIWRGAPFADFTYNDFVSAEVRRLVEMHRAVVADRIEADLATGNHSDLIGELEDLVTTHPFDERFRGQLMTALYRSGRQADALRAYKDARTILGEELGIEPSSALQELEEQILLQAPELGRLTVMAPTTNLPHYLTGFIGRSAELQRIYDLLDGNRLVTLTGLGGIGKTRAAVEAATERKDKTRHGVSMIDLAPVSDPLAVPQAFAESLGIRAEPSTSMEDALLNHLSRREMLLMVDNCEHLLEPTAHLLHRMLAAAPMVTILATSREPLGVPGEIVYKLPPLGVGDSGHGRPDALELFIDRAQRRGGHITLDEGFVAAALRVCERLDGIPLAIELAAARLRVMSIEDLGNRLDERFAILTGGDRTATPRHRTLEATLDWTYEQLSTAEQRLLRVLSPFRGGFDLEAAERCVAEQDAQPLLDLLTHLCDTSMVVAGDGHPVRYHMLETIREYAEAKLIDSGESDEAHRRHARCFAASVEGIGQATQDLSARYESLRLDEKNIRSAIDWTVDNGEPSLALDLAAGVGDYWFHNGDHELAGHTMAKVVENSTDQDPKKLFHAVGHMARLASWAGRTDEAHDLIARQRRIADTTDDRELMARSLAVQASSAWSQGHLDEARQLLIEAIGELDERVSANAIEWTGQVSSISSWIGDIVTAEEYIGRLERLADERFSERLEAVTIDARGELALQIGDLDTAADLFHRARDLYESGGLAFHVEDMLLKEAAALVDSGRIDEAEPLVDRALRISRELNDQRSAGEALLNQGRIAIELGDSDSAQHSLSTGLRLSDASGDRSGIVRCLIAMATLATRNGEPEQALRLHGIAASIGVETQLPAAVRARTDREIEGARATLGAKLADKVWREAVAAGYSAVSDVADGF